MFRQVLDFWFRAVEPKQWWAVDPDFDNRIRDRFLPLLPDFDNRIRDRFLPLLDQAARGELLGWRPTPQGRLAEVIVLDQFSRNIFRHSPRAFAQDPLALSLAREAVTSGALEQLEPMERAFLLMPYMHSESALVHQEAERLFREWAPQGSYDFELRHKAIIDRFGRYPHRNKTLGRASLPEEDDFLRQTGSSF